MYTVLASPYVYRSHDARSARLFWRITQRGLPLLIETLFSLLVVLPLIHFLSTLFLKKIFCRSTASSPFFWVRAFQEKFFPALLALFFCALHSILHVAERVLQPEKRKFNPIVLFSVHKNYRLETKNGDSKNLRLKPLREIFCDE